MPAIYVPISPVYGLPLRLAYQATASLDQTAGAWVTPTAAYAARLLDLDVATDINMDNHSATGHWVQIDFGGQYLLTSLYLVARGGGAGAGACSWTTSDGQTSTSASLGPSATATVTFTGGPVRWVRGTFTGANTNYDGWAEVTPRGRYWRPSV